MKNRHIVASVIAGALLLAGCGDPSQRQVVYPVWPEDLKDCKVYVVSDGVSSIRIVRCPNSTVSSTYMQGKASVTTVVIDGVEYERKDKQ